MSSVSRSEFPANKRNRNKGTVQLADLRIVPGVDAVPHGQPSVGGDHAVVRSGDRDARPAPTTRRSSREDPEDLKMREG